MNKVEKLKQEKDGLDVWADIERYARTGFESIDPGDFDRFKWYGIYQQFAQSGPLHDAHQAAGRPGERGTGSA